MLAKMNIALSKRKYISFFILILFSLALQSCHNNKVEIKSGKIINDNMQTNVSLLAINSYELMHGFISSEYSSTSKFELKLFKVQQVKSYLIADKIGKGRLTKIPETFKIGNYS